MQGGIFSNDYIVMINTEKKFYFRQLLIGLAIIWIITIIGIGIINAKIFTDTKNNLLVNIEMLSHTTNKKILENLKTHTNILHDLAKELDVQILNSPENSINYFKDIREKYNYRNLSIATIDGTSYTKEGTRLDLSTRDYFKTSLEGKTAISQLLTSKNDGVQVNVFSVPIIKENEVVGVLWASMTSVDFYNILDTKDLESIGDIYLVNRDGVLVTSKITEDVGLDFSSFIENTGKENEKALANLKNDLLNKKDGNQLFYYKNVYNYMYYTQVPVYEWWIFVNISFFDILSKSLHSMVITTIISIIILLVISIIIFISYIQIKRMNKKILESSFVDTVTSGKNDIYLKYYLHKNKENAENFALIDLEICNINKLISTLGIVKVQSIIKEKYYSIESTLKADEIITHGNLGRYKLLLKYTTTKSLLTRVEELNNINSGINWIIGIYFIESKEVSYELMHAYVSIAKGNLLPGKNYGIYTKVLQEKESERVQLEKDIDKAIKNQEFKAWFQPKYASDGKTLVGAEALVRWYKKETIVSPYVFIPMCESNGSIKEVDTIIFESVCLNIKEWMKQGKKPVPISINISRQYFNDLSFIPHLENVMHIYNIPRNFIEFEITESATMENADDLKRVIDTLHDKGFKVSLDDFGIGYSSIKTMADFHFDTIKIDKSFIDGIGNKQWEDVIKYTINLAKQLNANVVAEGVENKEQYEFLASCDCDIFQGYYFGKPMKTEDFMKLLENKPII